MIVVMMTPTSCVQEMDTPLKVIGVLGRNAGKEKFSVPKGVRYTSPSMMDIRPMVTMMTEMIGSPIRRRRNTRSTLMARKNVMMTLIKNEK